MVNYYFVFLTNSESSSHKEKNIGISILVIKVTHKQSKKLLLTSQIAHFQIFGGSHASNKNQHFAVFFVGIITEYQLLGHKTIHTSIIIYNVLDFIV